MDFTTPALVCAEGGHLVQQGPTAVSQTGQTTSAGCTMRHLLTSSVPVVAVVIPQLEPVILLSAKLTPFRYTIIVMRR